MEKTRHPTKNTVHSVEYLEDDEGELVPFEIITLSQAEIRSLKQQTKQDGTPDALHQGWEDLV